MSRRLLGIVLAVGMVGGVAVAAAPLALAARPHTVKKIIRPVHRNGTPVKGYSVIRATSGYPAGFTCTNPSAVSVSRGVAACGSTADGTIACWKSRRHTALCLNDPNRKVLRRYVYRGTFSASGRSYGTYPFTVLTARTGRCMIRQGAMDPLVSHPDWFQSYLCRSTRAPYTSIYDPPAQKGSFDRSKRLWRVWIGRKQGSSERVYRDTVRTVFFVGTAK